MLQIVSSRSYRGGIALNVCSIAALSAAVFALSSVPLELQRRIVNDAIKNGATKVILWLAVAYAGVALLEQLHEGRRGRYVFPGQKAGRPLSGMSMEMVLRRMGIHDATVHGFRSSFRDWAAETTPFPSEVVDMALAHAIEDKVEAAYRRGALFDKRRELMMVWADYVGA